MKPFERCLLGLTDRMLRADCVLALDSMTPTQALRHVQELSALSDRLVFKVGLELFALGGPTLVSRIKNAGARVFLDLKLHDIPQTVARAVQACCQMEVDFLTIHAAGGERMVQAAIEATRNAPTVVRILAVTVLTSFSPQEWNQIHPGVSITEDVQRMFEISWRAGCSGWVCSAQELGTLKTLASDLKEPPNPNLSQGQPRPYWMVPGIRIAHDPGGQPLADDQRRIATPQQALLSGASGIVLGRTLFQSTSPAALLEKLLTDLESKGL